ncbi:MAG TPA: sulfotransferase [Smithellaceae bacterium]|nr:sulfotransferase [Smithellaceae bacterium]
MGKYSFYPQFFIIGLQKCGTTALASYLQKHPDVLMSIPKEPHYFDTFYTEMNLNEYIRRCFGHRKNENILGEATPFYLRVPWALERLARHFPHAKYIALLRNPIERAYSSWWMYYSRAMEPFNFKEAIKLCLEQQEFAQMTEESWKKIMIASRRGETIHYRPYLNDGYYAQCLNKFFQYFDAKQLLIIKTEEFNQDTASVMKEVYGFLGLDCREGEIFEKYNEAYGSSARRIFKLAKNAGLLRFTQSVPYSVRSRIKKTLSKMGDKKPAMDPEMRAWLARHYAPYNLDLEKLLNRKFVWK